MQTSTSSNPGNHSGGPHLPTPSPQKRARVSTNNDTTVDDTSYAFENDEDWERQPYHYLRVTLIGIYCASPSCCSNPLLNKKGSNLWISSSRTIREHWKNNCCHVGEMPNGEATRRDLLSQQVLLHNQLKNSGIPTAVQEVGKLFPPTSPSKNMHFCSRCGFSTKKRDHIQRHYGGSNKQCNAQIHKMHGPVLKGLYGFQCPSHILEQIKSGQFTLPYNHGETIGSTLPSTPPATSPTPPATDTSPNQQLNSSIFSASSSQMTKAMSLSTHHDVANQSVKFNASIDCFIHHLSPTNDDHLAKSISVQKAYQHQSLLIPVIDNAASPQECISNFRKLSNNASAKFNPEMDDPTIQIIIQAAKLYFDSGAANFDVLRLSAFHRGMLYQVGVTDGVPNEEMMLQGSTFVPSKKIQPITEEVEHLILFVLRTNPSLISTQTKQALQIHSSVIDHHSNTLDEKGLAKEASSRVIDTNAVHGMMIAILLEQSDRLKPNTLQLFLVGRAIKSVQNASHLDFYHPNLISKRSSTLLRAMRHFICGHVVNSARDNRYQSESAFAKETFQLIRAVQTCTSVDAICRNIRMAKEIDSKLPSKVEKGFDPSTGEVRVEEMYIKRETWGSTISEMNDRFRKHLFPLFHPQSHCLIESVLNISNKLVMSVDECYVYTQGEYRNCYQDLFYQSSANHHLCNILFHLKRELTSKFIFHS